MKVSLTSKLRAAPPVNPPAKTKGGRVGGRRVNPRSVSIEKKCPF